MKFFFNLFFCTFGLNEVYIDYLNQVNEGVTKAHRAPIRGLVSIKQSS